VKILFEKRVQELEGSGIIATGPHGADIIAKGMLFETDMADQAVAILDDRLAPKGYAYLLIHQNRATLATALFREYRRERDCFERTVETFDRLLGLKMSNPREFGGFGNFYIRPSAVRGGKLYTGESAGFQDFLWGFGMRYALLSGYLAARSIIEGRDYDQLWKAQILPSLKTSLSNRYLFERLGNKGYSLFVKWLDKADQVRDFLYRHYNPSFWKWLVYPLARRAYESRVKDRSCTHEDCDCVWCKHQKLSQAKI
ncbi:MAG: hypothetical protein L0Y56_21780, partial [Nitrospira sp.]|nr:hypothetical protein [Nitrospira sp.]